MEISQTLSSVYSNLQSLMIGRDFTYHGWPEISYLMQEEKTWGTIQNVQDLSLLRLCHLIAFIPEITSKSWYRVRSLNM